MDGGGEKLSEQSISFILDCNHQRAFFSTSVISRNPTGCATLSLTTTPPESSIPSSSMGVSLTLSSSHSPKICSRLYLNGWGFEWSIPFVSPFGRYVPSVGEVGITEV